MLKNHVKQSIKLSGGKKIREARINIDKGKFYDNLPEVIELLQKVSFAKFDESLDIAIKLGVDPRHSDQMVRGAVVLPSGIGKSVKVAVMCKEDRIEEAKEAGADFVNLFDLIESIKSGKIEFEVCIATPDVMGMIGQVAKILGPRGLMPNPKLGTVTNDIVTAIKNVKKGQVEFRVEKNGIIHATVGKISFISEQLVANINALVSAIIKSKPSGAKGTYLKDIYLSTTMGPSIQLDTSIFAKNVSKEK